MQRTAPGATRSLQTPYGYRLDRAVPPLRDDKPVIVFDGMCSLCSGWVRFVLRHDRSGRYRFLSAQAGLGRALYSHYGLDPVDYETNILIEDGLAHFKSEACLRIAEGLGFPWSLASLCRVLPMAWRDKAYGLVARNRIRLFGRPAACYRPEPGDAERFLA
jgi:predicted DCC family thiol-disulfide oxidoreductase YuxK